MEKNIEKKFFTKWLILMLAIFFILIATVVSSYFIFEKKYKDKIYPGIYVGQFNLSGLYPNEAKQTLNEKVDQIDQNGITIKYNNNQITLLPFIPSTEEEGEGLVYQLINFEIDKNVEQAYNFGRSGNFYNDLRQKIKAYFKPQYFEATTVTNDQEINKFLYSKFSHFETPAQDAKLTYNIENDQSIKFDVQEEKYGQVIDYDKGLEKLKNNISRLDDSPIELAAKVNNPNIYKNDCLNINNKAQELISLAPLALKNGEDKWTISKKQLAGWLILELNKNASSSDDKILVKPGFEPVKEYLDRSVIAEINKEPLNSKFKIQNGKVVEFQKSKEGFELNVEQSIKKIYEELTINKNNQIEFVVDKKESIDVNKVNDLGIEELIGTGKSNFAGSPKNRRHNIKTGANAVNGLLIPPNEEFSLIKALGKIDASSGYLPELVIRDNKTTPEFGGGLCQVGTTMFRAVINTGLPVTMRYNHSYRVSYYEPAGTDATIYDPWPDFKFLNDTPNYVLIQARIQGDNLYFDFWGTKDGRKATSTYPVIYNIKKPEPTKYIETTELPEGQKKCTEKAHNGADAYFNYKVTYASGEVKEKRFNSHYVPWREVCLIGIKKSTDTQIPPTTTISTSTPASSQ